MRLLFIHVPLVAAVVPSTVTESMVAADSAPQCDLLACKRLYGTFNECYQKTTEEEIKACICVQAVLNDFVECKGDSRECGKGYHLDNTWDDMIDLWHDQCSPYFTFTPTTPILTPLSTTMDPDACKSVYGACLRRDVGVKSCSEAYSPSPTEVVSCLCQPTHLLVASVCYVDRTKCFPTETANISTVLEYSYCQPTWLSSVAQSTANTTVFPTTQPPTTHPPPTQSSISFTRPTVIPTTQSTASEKLIPSWTLLATFVMTCFFS
ncbi:hypothetical protein DL764_007905 [Monosporascus ibericus]|uniref:Uncharacterized protein n=1 Tax=Monosporascus ibericus TaxID=155417 RepID=A0A4Q4T2A4_9PEZI|nr:hypothetical protein DL764_007905 [Monosporascus ibericus]